MEPLRASSVTLIRPMPTFIALFAAIVPIDPAAKLVSPIAADMPTSGTLITPSDIADAPAIRSPATKRDCVIASWRIAVAFMVPIAPPAVTAELSIAARSASG